MVIVIPNKPHIRFVPGFQGAVVCNGKFYAALKYVPRK